MKLVGRIFFCLLALLMLNNSITAADLKNSRIMYRAFWQPSYRGERLNYCMPDGENCGGCVADRYCQIMGYEKATGFIIEHNVGCSIFFDCTKCKLWTCNGFKNINCSRKMPPDPKPYHYRFRRFFEPCYNYYRVDWCYDGSKGCGRRAALSFCRRMGYMGVKRFCIDNDIGTTQAIGNQQICFGEGCHAFKEIDCYR